MPAPLSPPPYAPHDGIAALRQEGWSLPLLAERLGASVRTVSRWAAGYTRPLPVYEKEIAALVAQTGEGT